MAREDHLHAMQPTSISLAAVDDTAFAAKVNRLAARLGIDPVHQSDDRQFRMLLVSGDKRYDVIDLMHAFLDRLENS